MVSAPVLDRAEPKSDKIYAFHLPLTGEWSEHKDWFNQTAMTVAGAGIFIKHPLLVWISLGMAVIGFVNQQPLRQSKEATNPIWTLGRGEDAASRAAQEPEWDQLESHKQREKVREKAVEEREREVAHGEKWIVDEMRMLSDKVHLQAAELTLEDRITERLKSYQRQLANMEERTQEL